jgi:hypothetical protein
MAALAELGQNMLAPNTSCILVVVFIKISEDTSGPFMKTSPHYYGFVSQLCCAADFFIRGIFFISNMIYVVSDFKKIISNKNNY